MADDRIQWFRAEADFERWQERVESLHAEFTRMIDRFTKDRDSWASLATKHSTTAGHVAYAKEHADMFESLRLDAELKFKQVRLDFLTTSVGETLADRVLLWRANQETAFRFNRYVPQILRWVMLFESCTVGPPDLHLSIRPFTSTEGILVNLRQKMRRKTITSPRGPSENQALSN